MKFRISKLCTSCFAFCLIFISMFMLVNYKVSAKELDTKEFDFKLYIIEDRDRNELIVDTYEFGNYRVESVKFIDLKTNEEIKSSFVDSRLFIYEKLKENREYKYQLTLINIRSKEKERVLYESKFKHIQGNIIEKKIGANYLDAEVAYSKKNLVFIEDITVYGRISGNTEDKYDFIVRKNSSELENYKDKAEFYNLNLKTGTNYDIYCAVRVNNNVTIVTQRKVRSEKFKISELNSNMISDRTIKLNWNTSNQNIKLLNNDSIKIFVKGKSDWNYSQIPNLKIKDDGVYSATIDVTKVEPSYEIKLVYSLGGENLIITTHQLNDFHKLRTISKITGLRNLNLNFGFENKFKFKNDEVLNIYLIDKSNPQDYKKIFSKKISDITFNPEHRIIYSDLKLDREYKLFYEILYKDGSRLKIKEDEFKTLKFGMKKFNLSTGLAKDRSLKFNLSWSFSNSKFRFIKGDSISVYIKKKSESNYPTKPIIYRNTDLESLSSISFDINEEYEGSYDIKVVYNIGGEEYTEFKDLYLNNNITTFKKVNKPAQLEKKGFYVNVRDSRANEVILEFLYPKDFKFTEKDELQIYTTIEGDSSSVETLHSKYTHSTTTDLRKMKLIKISGLKPEQKYKFKAIIKTKEKIDSNKPVDETVPDNVVDFDENTIVPPKPEETPNPPAEEKPPTPPEQNDQTPPAEGTPPKGEEGADSTPPKEETPDKNDNAENPDKVEKPDNSQNSGNSESSDNSQNSGNEGKPNNSENASDPRLRGLFGPSSSGSNGLKENQKEVIAETKKFSINNFAVKESRTNSALFEWSVDPAIVTVNEGDMVQIFVKRKITNGYPAGPSFELTGNDIKKTFTGEAIVKYMDTEYDAKLVYIISGVKYEQVIPFKTQNGTTSCKIRDVSETTAILDVVYPKDYKFLEGDCVEIYLKEEGKKTYGSPVFTIFHIGDVILQDTKTFNFIYLKPRMMYDVMVKFINKSGANDIPDAHTQFLTSPLILENCRIDSLNGDRLKIKTDVKNDMDVFNDMQVYVDVFYKTPDKTNYSGKSIFTSSKELLEFEFELPDKTKDYDFLISYNPHGFFNETYFIEFEVEYRTIRAVIDESIKETEKGKRNSYDLKWAYPTPVNFEKGDKINIYLKELPKEPEKVDGNQLNQLTGKKETTTNQTDQKDIVDSYAKIHTIDAQTDTNTSFNLDYFLNENKKYEILIEVVSTKYKAGACKIELKVGKLLLEEEAPKDEEINFDVPINVDQYTGLGSRVTFKVPNADKIHLTKETNLSCDIDGVDVKFDGEDINVRGLVPLKEYAVIGVKAKIDGDKELLFNIENIKLEPEDGSQKFLYDVYKRSFLRDPDEMGYKYWIDRLIEKNISSRDFLINLLFAEKEFSEMQYTTDKFISVLYSIIVDRDPDPDGLNYWIDFYNKEAIKNSNGDVFLAKKYIVDRMINEKEFEKLMIKLGFQY